jgi:hypothetical protein
MVTSLDRQHLFALNKSEHSKDHRFERAFVARLALTGSFTERYSDHPNGVGSTSTPSLYCLHAIFSTICSAADFSIARQSIDETL